MQKTARILKGGVLVFFLVVWSATLFGDLEWNFQGSSEGNFVSTGFAVGSFFLRHDPSHAVDSGEGLRFTRHPLPSFRELRQWIVGRFQFARQPHDSNYHFTRFPLGPVSVVVPLWPLPAIALAVTLTSCLTKRRRKSREPSTG